MRWEKKYPNVQMGDETASSLWYSPVIGTCFMCQSRTPWVDICFGAHLCSEECEQEVIKDLAKRTRQDAGERNSITS